MPSRFTSGAYAPDLVKLMGDVLDAAWRDFAPRPKNEELGRSLMATAIIEAVEAGETRRHILARKATVALMSAIKLDPALLKAGRGSGAPSAQKTARNRAKTR